MSNFLQYIFVFTKTYMLQFKLFYIFTFTEMIYNSYKETK